MHLPDIKDKEDIKIFVDKFYERVQKDQLIGPVFLARIEEGRWPIHLERMYTFWNTVLFAQMDYRGNPFSKHRDLPIEAEHFDRWVKLFKQTIDENFAGDKAEDAKGRADKMALMFISKLHNIRSNEGFKNII